MVCHNTFQNDSKAWVYPEDVEKKVQLFQISTGKPVVMGEISQCQNKKNVMIQSR